MKITSVETIPISVPIQTKGTLQSRGDFTKFVPKANITLVKVHTDVEITGLGETGFLTFKTINEVIDEHITPFILGKDPFEMAEIHSSMDLAEMNVCERYAPFYAGRSAIDMALYDILGKALHVPIYKLLGGPVRKIVPLEPGVVTIGSVQETVKGAEGLREIGHKVVKLKVGLDERLDLERVKAVREALGDDVKIRVDVNQGWTPKLAIKMIEKMDRYDLHLVEQPVSYWDLKGMAEVKRSVNVPIMADESLWGPYDAINLIRFEAADIFNIYINKSPGIYNSMKIAQIGEPAGITCDVAPGGPYLGRIASAHVSASIKNLADGGSMRRLWIIADDLLVDPPRITKEGLELPTGPGLGVDLKEEKVEKYRVKQQQN
jgi:L-alanine-DL-glutamate epimerase-like enolase superfamily enzyme